MKTATAVILGAGGALIFMVVAVMILASPSIPHGEVDYNYTIDVQDSFIDKYGDTEKADVGKQFAIVICHIYNKTYDDKVTTNDLIWQMKLTLGGIQYHSSSWHTFLHPKYALIDIPKGSDGVSVWIYEIPTGHTASEMGIDLKVLYTHATINYDPSLPV